MMWVSLVVILPLFWKGITCQAPGYSIRVASSVGVQEGLCVTIPCTFTANNGNTFSNSSGFWIQVKEPKSPFYIVASNNKSSDVKKPNFHLTGNPDTGDCTLSITDAKKEDEGEYFFRFEDKSVRYGYVGKATAITVTDLTEEPVISDLGKVIAGINKTLTCSPPRNCTVKSLHFQWRKSNVDRVWIKNSSIVTFTPSPNDHHQNITCEMTNTKEKTTRRTILLDIDCPTAIEITQDIGKEKMKSENVIKVDAGSSMTLRCLVGSNLTDLRFNVTWTDKKNVLQHGTGKELELRLDNVMVEHSGVYTCSVITECGTNTANVTISVQYPPRNMKITIQTSRGEELPLSQPIFINQTETLTLGCKVESNPNASVVWVEGGFDVETFKTSKNALSAIINVTSSSVDGYRCVAWNAFGFREQRIQVGLKTSITPNNQESNSFRDIVLAFLCGMSIMILVIMLYKLVTWKKCRKEKSYMKAKEPSASANLPENEIYMNVSNTEPKAEESASTSAQLDPMNPNDVTSDEDLHYSTVAFTAKPSKVPPSQPETEYAEINVK